MGSYDVKRNDNGSNSFYHNPTRLFVAFNVPNPYFNIPLGFVVMVPEEEGEKVLMQQFGLMQSRMYSSPNSRLFDLLRSAKKDERVMAYKEIHNQLSLDSGIRAGLMGYYTGKIKNGAPEVKSFDIPTFFATASGYNEKGLQDLIVYEGGKPHLAIVEEIKKGNVVQRTVENKKVVGLLSQGIHSIFGSPLKVLQIPLPVQDPTGATQEYETIMLKPGEGAGLDLEAHLS